MAGLATTFGSGAMTNSINEIEAADVILISGSNTTEAHPQVARRMLAARDRGARLIVIDPRRTAIARHADIHLALKPGSDIPLLSGLMRIILDENLADDLFIEMRTENFFALRDRLYRLNLDQVCEQTGLSLADLRRAALLYGRAQKAVICYCLGVTQHVCGTANVEALANLAMLTGNVEKEDAGVAPLRGQNNVQGACDMGALPGMLPGYQPVTDPEVRRRFAAAWGVEPPSTVGLTLLAMTHGRSGAGNREPAQPDQPAGEVRGMLIMGENPLLSDPDLTQAENNLTNLDFLAVSDIFLTETAAVADVVFPAACFAEKEGCFTNTERRVQLLRRAVAPPGQARSDRELIAGLSRRLGYPMDYDSAAEIMEEIALLTPIYGGIYHDRLAGGWGLQWPCWNRAHPGTPFLHKYYFTRGRGRFVDVEPRPPAEPPDEEYPLLLNTGRIYHHYHTGTMTRKSALLNRECGHSRLQINPREAENLQLANGERVRLISRRGQVELYAELTREVPPGMVYGNFHFAEAPINRLTTAACDRRAQCPEYKICAVRLEKTGGGDE